MYLHVRFIIGEDEESVAGLGRVLKSLLRKCLSRFLQCQEPLPTQQRQPRFPDQLDLVTIYTYPSYQALNIKTCSPCSPAPALLISSRGVWRNSEFIIQHSKFPIALCRYLRIPANSISQAPRLPAPLHPSSPAHLLQPQNMLNIPPKSGHSSKELSGNSRIIRSDSDKFHRPVPSEPLLAGTRECSDRRRSLDHDRP